MSLIALCDLLSKCNFSFLFLLFIKTKTLCKAYSFSNRNVFCKITIVFFFHPLWMMGNLSIIIYCEKSFWFCQRNYQLIITFIWLTLTLSCYLIKSLWKKLLGTVSTTYFPTNQPEKRQVIYSNLEQLNHLLFLTIDRV